MAHWLEIVVNILDSETSDLRTLAQIAGYDPKIFYKGTSMHGVDLSRQDISDLDLEGVEEFSVADGYSAREAKEYIIRNETLPGGWGEKIIHFRASRRILSNINQLRNTPNLKEVRVSGTWIDNIESLSNCKMLERLYISRNFVSDLSPISKLVRIFDLDISWTTVEDISPISGIAPVHLDISGCPISDITSLNVERLWSFNMRKTKISDISVLEDAYRLKILNVAGALLDSISCLRNLGGLRRFYADETNIRDFNAIGNNENLDSFSAKGCSFDSAEFLGYLTGIRHLSLDETNITDVEFARFMSDLRTLEVPDTRVNDISALEGLGELRWLDISGTAVNDVRKLSSIKSLQSLDMADTKISRIADLSGCEALRSLNADNCEELYLDDLGNLTISHLSLRGIEVGAEIFEIAPKSLKTLDISPNLDFVLADRVPQGWKSAHLSPDTATFVRSGG